MNESLKEMDAEYAPLPGFQENRPSEWYHAIDYASASLLKAGAKSWKQAKYRKDHPQDPTPAMVLGTRVHSSILEPHKTALHPVKPKGMNFSTKEGKAWRDENPGFITQEDNDAIQGMTESVWQNPDAKALLSLPGRRELSAFALDEDTGLPLKSRFDFLANDGILVDVKTTDCARLFEWQRTCAKYLYHVQAAFYSDVYKRISGDDPKAFFFVAVERDAPYECCVYQIGDASIEKGRMEYTRLLWEYRACVESGVWPGYFSGTKQFDLPRWALNSEPDQDELIYSLA